MQTNPHMSFTRLIGVILLLAAIIISCSKNTEDTYPYDSDPELDTTIYQFAWLDSTYVYWSYYVDSLSQYHEYTWDTTFPKTGIMDVTIYHDTVYVLDLKFQPTPSNSLMCFNTRGRGNVGFLKMNDTLWLEFLSKRQTSSETHILRALKQP